MNFLYFNMFPLHYSEHNTFLIIRHFYTEYFFIAFYYYIYNINRILIPALLFVFSGRGKSVK